MTQSNVRVGVRNLDLSESQLRYLAQLGIEDVFVDQTTEPGPDRLAVSTDNVPSVERLVQTRKRLEEEGLRFTGIQSLSGAVYDDIMFGEEGAEEQTAAIKQLLRNMGKADVPILGYQWNPRARNVVFSTSTTKRIRGGARTREFDLNEIRDPEESTDPDAPEYDESAFWDRYESFLEEVLPVAEEAGVRMALHPADPPVVEKLEGIPRLFRDVDSFERAMNAVPSDNHGLKLCLGCFSEMGEDVVDVVERFGERGDVVFVHFRDVVGAMPKFHETFVDEGNFDEREVIEALDAVGFDGAVLPDHVPQMEGDTDWGHRGRGYTVGYLRGLVRGVQG
ncbi:MAG: mannonate dehydratase [Halobacteriaceae archaeon]